jgi:hypothetical protein
MDYSRHGPPLGQWPGGDSDERAARKTGVKNALIAGMSSESGSGARAISVRRKKASHWCARQSWRDPAGVSPAREKGSANPVVSVASWKVTTTAKRTQ